MASKQELMDSFLPDRTAGTLLHAEFRKLLIRMLKELSEDLNSITNIQSEMCTN